MSEVEVWVDDYPEESNNYEEMGRDRRILYEKHAVENERLNQISERAKKELVEFHRSMGIDIEKIEWPKVYFVKKEDVMRVKFKSDSGANFDRTANAIVIALEEDESQDYFNIIKLYHELGHVTGYDEKENRIGFDYYHLKGQGELMEEVFVHYMAVTLANRSADPEVMKSRRRFGEKLARGRFGLGIFAMNSSEQLDQLVKNYFENKKNIDKRKTVSGQGVIIAFDLIELAKRSGVETSDFIRMMTRARSGLEVDDFKRTLGKMYSKDSVGALRLEENAFSSETVQEVRERLERLLA